MSNNAVELAGAASSYVGEVFENVANSTASTFEDAKEYVSGSAKTFGIYFGAAAGTVMTTALTAGYVFVRCFTPVGRMMR